MLQFPRRIIVAMGSILLLTHCGGLSSSDLESESSAAAVGNKHSDLAAPYSKFDTTVSIEVDDDQVVIETQDIPNHPSPYFSSDNELYEDPDSGMVVNPNRIQAQNYRFQIPTNPQLATTESETNLDAIGVATNGVVFFNQYAGRTLNGDWLPLDNEIDTFDRFNGHPAQRGNYHYHMEPFFLSQDDPTALLGVMLDGFPIYGPQDQDASKPRDLDECNGHSAATAEFPEGIYHYHTTEQEPYLVGCFRGKPGTVSN